MATPSTKIVKVFRRDEDGNCQEIGQASEVETSIEFPAIHQLLPTDTINQTVIFDGWKYPISSNQPLIVPRTSLPFMAIENLELTIAALVNMLGGAVSISEEEFYEATMTEIEASQEMGPRGKRFIINTRPGQVHL